MERTEYRRSEVRSAAKPHSRPGVAGDSEAMETILTQCIISGVVLLVILLLCLVKTEFTQNIRMSLKNAIAGETTMEDIKSVLNIAALSSGEDGGGAALVSGGAQTKNATGTQMYAAEDNAGEAAVTEETGDFRIDEDILAEINSKTDSYGENLKK